MDDKKQTFIIKNFLTSEELSLAKSIDGEKEPFFDVQGIYKGKITSTQQWINNKSNFTKFIQAKLNTIEELSPVTIDGIQILRATDPYDVHSDWVVTNNQIPIADPIINPPTYTILIPMIPGDYQTIVFNQRASYNNFSTYKQDNPELTKNYCSDFEWNKYCSHCDKEDQRYLTIKEVFEWEIGTLFAFNRRLFHCSANFGKLSKKAIVMWLSKH